MAEIGKLCPHDLIECAEAAQDCKAVSQYNHIPSEGCLISTRTTHSQ